MKASYHFPPRIRAASIVPRWSIMWTTEKDTVSSHSFFVSIYAKHIADLIQLDRRFMYPLLWMSLTHDLDEVITGDIVAPAKRAVVDTKSLDRFVDMKAAEVIPFLFTDRYHKMGLSESDMLTVLSVLKVADALDAVLFAVVEEVRGNLAIASRVASCMSRLEMAWKKMDANESLKREAWKHVQEAIRQHSNPQMHDIDIPPSEEDEIPFPETRVTAVLR